ncbi:4-hydroxythreonine-4-phosphate dehydrogenase PdxA [Anaerocolumna aminovalerica]|uniref:4-hydroxythreonine-4-phosphate dehydrogenase n=1 Tax=Anaerocolumna aminovalerica TaxID=1527 RepID=A0A1I5EDZ0_9FIRM|nr:4-hydroxythreonine-4-phosphate dehydrogenase PdxA [Anaerocolumna aminovalerica]SFO09742.1 4-hydroxythreonine-4-phosphate dehydrogenase [Anaerocolumna aminovalerica]
MRPLIAIPIGDPAGIGPEIVVKAIINKEVLQAARCVVIGDKNIIEDAIGFTKVPLKVNVIEHPEDGIYEEGILNLIDLHNVDMTEFRIGEIRGICGKAAYEYIAKSIELANAREVDAVSTTPINKESLKAGGIPYIGHTEIFGALTGTKDPLTMFEVHGMRVFFLSRHVSLRQACNMVKKERIIDYVIRCKEVLATLGLKEGTMAVAGLNPHSGEHGLFGNEEVEEVMPAVEELQRRGYDVAGPIGADSVFHLALQGRYNSVLSMYHDQGHIATKTLDFEKTIAVTGGMPILRTSVDHGTAMDIAGKGIASEVSMIEAILLGAKYSPNFTGA